MKYKYFIFSIIVIFLTVSFAACRQRHDKPDSTRSDRVITQKATQNNVVRNQSIVKMRKKANTYYVPCKINGVEMEFLFDTGASDITISLTEALFLYKQGKLSDKDLRNTELYQTADGSIHEGMVVILRRVEIGDWVLSNVKASIVENMVAPLLLGQSALAAFGKISIDYKRNEITFE